MVTWTYHIYFTATVRRINVFIHQSVTMCPSSEHGAGSECNYLCLSRIGPRDTSLSSL